MHHDHQNQAALPDRKRSLSFALKSGQELLAPVTGGRDSIKPYFEGETAGLVPRSGRWQRWRVWEEEQGGRLGTC